MHGYLLICFKYGSLLAWFEFVSALPKQGVCMASGLSVKLPIVAHLPLKLSVLKRNPTLMQADLSQADSAYLGSLHNHILPTNVHILT